MSKVNMMTIQEYITSFLPTQSFFGFCANLDATYYRDYFSGKKEGNHKDKKDIEVLEMLKELGFSMEEPGTYFYKDVVMKAAEMQSDCMLETDSNLAQLSHLLSDPYSQFYFDLARNERDMGIKTFHSHIAKAMSKTQFSHVNPSLWKDVYGTSMKNSGFVETTLLLSSYISERKRNMDVERPVVLQKVANFQS